MKLHLQFSSVSRPAHALWVRYAKLIYKLCVRKCGDSDKARDFFQDIYIKFHLHAKEVEKHPAPEYWFMRVVANHYFSYCRKKKVLVGYCAEIGVDYDAGFSLEEMLRMDLKTCPMNTLEKVVIEFTVCGFSRKEIAEILGISIPSVRNKLLRVAEKLRAGEPTKNDCLDFRKEE